MLEILGSEPMSTNESETLRVMFDRFNRRDLPGFLRLCDPDVEWFPLVSRTTDKPFRGHDGIREWWKALEDGFECFENVVEAVEDHGEWVLCLGRGRARARTSGVELDEPWVQLARLRNGRVAWLRTFRSRAEALSALAG